MTKIAVLVGSLSEGSVNKKLAKGIEGLLPEGVEFVYGDINLPLFDYELEADFPSKPQALKDLIEGADGVLFVTPEYNRSFSGVLKNAIDWASRPYGANSFNNKPAAIIGASASPLGTTQAQAALRNTAIHLNTKLIGQPEVYFDAGRGLGEDGALTDDAKGTIQPFVDAFVEHVKFNS